MDENEQTNTATPLIFIRMTLSLICISKTAYMQTLVPTAFKNCSKQAAVLYVRVDTKDGKFCKTTL